MLADLAVLLFSLAAIGTAAIVLYVLYAVAHLPRYLREAGTFRRGGR